MDKALAWDKVAAVEAPPVPVRRPLAFLLHSLFGLKLSLFVGFICLTGTIATVSHEIEWLVRPEVRASAPARPADWGRMWDAVRAAYPNAKLQGIGPYDRSDADYFAKTASVSLTSGQDIEVYVDPARGVTGETRGPTFHHIMRGLHYYLLAPGDLPFYLVTAMGPVLLLSLVTGLLTYKKFWRGFFRMPRWGRDARTIWGDVHRLVGLWTIWFVAVIGLTCVWYIVDRACVDFETT